MRSRIFLRNRARTGSCASVSTSRKRARRLQPSVADVFKREGIELGRFVPGLEFTAPALK